MAKPSVKVKGPHDSVKRLLGGTPRAHAQEGNAETKRKVKAESRFNPRNAPDGDTPRPTKWSLAEQPVSGM